MNAMMTLGYTEDVILAIWRTVGALLELGNIQFHNVDTSEGQASQVDNDVHVTHAAELLEINVTDLVTLFTKRVVMMTVGEKITKSLTAEESLKIKNAFIKALYANLFQVLVSSLNSSFITSQSSQPLPPPTRDVHSIGILDIFGFESFQRNEFEQLLINYANESLQNTFNEQIFQNELKLYQEEDIKVNLSLEECPSNSFCVNLIYSYRPSSSSSSGGAGVGPSHQSIISILQSVAQSPKGSDEMFCESLHKILPNHPSPIIRRYFPPVHPKDRKVLFTINHFAGSVTYHVGDKGQNIWLNKNHDTIPDDMFPVLSSSHSSFIQSLAAAVSGNQTTAPSKQRKQSIADVFSQSMTELCHTLKASDCSFIRCIKPNKSSSPRTFDLTYVIPQMRALGLVQVCEVMRVGLTKRISFDELKNIHPDITTEILKSIPHESGEVIAAILLWALEIPDEAYSIGKSRVFFKSHAGDLYDRLLETKSSLTEEVLSKIKQAIQVRQESKGIIENLEKKSSELLKQFHENQARTDELIEKLSRCDAQFISLSKEGRIISSVIPKIVKKLSTIETTVQEIKEHVSDLKINPAAGADFTSLHDSLQLIESQLNNCDDIWSNIDTKLNSLTTFLATQPIDLLRNHRAQISNELSSLDEELFPEVQHLIQKTIEEANRCQLNKLGKRAEDCEYNLDLVQQRLEGNTEEIQELSQKFQSIQIELDAMSALAREISSHQQHVTGVCENITKLSTEIRKKASVIRLKLIRDEEERVRVEKELQEREDRIRQEQLQREVASTELQHTGGAGVGGGEEEEEDSFDPRSINDDGLELPPGWEWNHERQLYFNLLTREYQVDVPTGPAMSHHNTGIDEVMDHTNLDEVTEFDFDGIRVYTFVDPEPPSSSAETGAHIGEESVTDNNRTSRVIVETIYDSEKKSSSSSSGEEKGKGTKKIVKEVSYVYDGIRVYTTKEVDENEENEKEENKKNEESERIEAMKQQQQQSITTELNQKISRVFKQGYLQKQGKYFGSWKKLYFVVSGNSIAHYPSKQSYQCGALPTKIIQLTGLSVLSYTRFNLCFTVHTGGRTYWTMMAEDKTEFQQWMDKLNTVIGALFDSRIQACLDQPPATDRPELF
jgi:myosin heavy subunit